MDALLLNLLSSPWAMEADKIDVMVRVLARRYTGKRGWENGDGATIADQAAVRGGAYPVGDVAVLPLAGIISPRGNMLVDSSGFVSIEMWIREFERLVRDSEVKAIVLDVDSPGGSYPGVPEAAARVFAARDAKPIVAVSNYLNASAAYLISSQAHEVVGSVSSMTGSIGIYRIHENLGAALEAEGVDVTTVFAGKFKTEWAPFGPLSEAALEFAQEQVNEGYAQFLSAVARGRGTTADQVRAGYGEGRALRGAAAVAANLIDRVATLEGTVQRLQSPQARGRVRASGESLQSPQADPVDGAELAAAVKERLDSAGAEPPDAPD
ncbi:MAG: S49 family peptidase [Gammaproteobacteria bacterium]|nr:S49 family peptidase [Gammaproteobacteria bacterium]